MNNLNAMKLVLALIDPDYPIDISIKELVKDKKLLKSATKLADKNGLYYSFITRLKELEVDIPHSEGDRWDEENQKLLALKKTFTFLNDMKVRYSVDYILIKACTKIPHIPRDIDILVRIEDKENIYEMFACDGMEVAYSNEVETSFNKEGYAKLDIYSEIQYIGMDFIDVDFLWNSEIEDEMFGIRYPSLSDEANFLLLFIHSLFGHRSMTLLDFLHMRCLMKNIQDISTCRDHAYEKGWGQILDMGLERLEDIYKTIYMDGGVVLFPYLFDRKFTKKCVALMEGLDMKNSEKMFFQISLVLDRIVYELAKTPFYDSLLAFKTGRRMFNSFAYFVGARRGDRHGIYEGNGNK